MSVGWLGIRFKKFKYLKVCYIENGWNLFCVSFLGKVISNGNKFYNNCKYWIVGFFKI